MKMIFGDLTAMTSGIIAHQVNTQGVMGKGLAGILNKTFPGLQSAVKSYIATVENPESLIGTVYYFQATPTILIANCFSEIGMCSDRKEGDPPNTSYDAVIRCFNSIESNPNKNDKEVYIPFKYGCGLAGGNWDIMLKIFKDYDLNVVARTSDYETWINEKFKKI